MIVSSARHLARRGGGFTVAEVLLAMGLLLFGATAIIGLFALSFRTQGQGITEAEAVIAGQSAMAVLAVDGQFVFPTGVDEFEPMLNADSKPFVVSSDPDDRFNYAMVWRRKDLTQVELAMFVFERNADAGASGSVYLADAIDCRFERRTDTSANLSLPNGARLPVSSVVLAEPIDGTKGNYAVVKVVGPNRVVPDLAYDGRYRIHYVPSGAYTVLVRAINAVP